MRGFYTLSDAFSLVTVGVCLRTIGYAVHAYARTGVLSYPYNMDMLPAGKDKSPGRDHFFISAYSWAMRVSMYTAIDPLVTASIPVWPSSLTSVRFVGSVNKVNSIYAALRISSHH